MCVSGADIGRRTTEQATEDASHLHSVGLNSIETSSANPGYSPPSCTHPHIIATHGSGQRHSSIGWRRGALRCGVVLEANGEYNPHHNTTLHTTLLILHYTARTRFFTKHLKCEVCGSITWSPRVSVEMLSNLTCAKDPAPGN